MQSNNFQWPNGQKCAVSLTYDDGLPAHYDYVGPLLSQAGLSGTFYIPIKAIKPDALHHPEQWRTLAARGHELGNHTLFHPCRRDPERHTWLEECYDLGHYTLSRLRSELEIASLVLYLIDGVPERSYGNTCCNTTIGQGEQEVSMDGVLQDLFVAARGPYNSQVADVRKGLNLMQVGHYGADGPDLADIQADIEGAAKIGGWIVWMIHGVGEGTHRLYLDQGEHEKLIAWLGANKTDIWTAPFIEVAQYVKQCQTQR